MKRVICINNDDQPQLVINMTYEVNLIAECECGLIAYGLKEITEFNMGKDPSLGTMCECGENFRFKTPVFHSKRFLDIEIKHRYEKS